MEEGIKQDIIGLLNEGRFFADYISTSHAIREISDKIMNRLQVLQGEGLITKFGLAKPLEETALLEIYWSELHYPSTYRLRLLKPWQIVDESSNETTDLGKGILF